MNVQINTPGMSSQNFSYARIVQSLPTKKQAILLFQKDDSALIEYIVAIGRIIGPKNILAASKISKRRICIYLSSVEIVDQLLSKHKSITVNNTINSREETRRTVTTPDYFKRSPLYP